ncbi:insulinase family protein [Asanoa iriomotensis]|uniref:insulinase family protein n=1 Tax=Asanoa iriomotensis TaxID=234613 RepID=UPI001EF2E2C7|nr:insulinase family protein [Asanoa iriomotensis]
MTRTEVDGVPTLVAPTVGPPRAGLVFRVGQADETLARRGITHLVEHLALHPIGGSAYHHNGNTGLTTTTFYAQGEPDDLVDFFTRLCGSLAALDTGRLAMERDVLRTEEHGRGSGPTRDLPLWRYGSRGYGLVSYPEWGLHALTADDLLAWVAAHFTRENAVLWVAGDGVPAGLRLDLPSGHRQPVPAPTSALPATPAFFAGGPSTATDTVVPESAAAIVYAHLLQRRLYKALRLDTGLSYTTAVEYAERGDGNAVIAAYVDALDEKQDAVLGGVIDVLAALRAAPAQPADLAVAVSGAVRDAGGVDAAAGLLPTQSFRLLTGRPLGDVDTEVAALGEVTAEAAHAVAQEAHKAALLMAPPRGAAWAGYAPAPTTSETRIRGRDHARTSGDGPHLHVGDDGVSVVGTDDEAATVRYAECTVMLAHPDGRRVLIGHDGMVVVADPAVYAALNVEAIDRRVPPEVVVRMPGQPSASPAPGSVAAARRWLSRRRLGPGWLRLAALGLLTAVVGGAALTYTIGMIVGFADARVIGLIGGWLIAGWFGRSFLRAWSARRGESSA